MAGWVSETSPASRWGAGAARGEFLGLWRFVGDVGHAGGPLVVGHIADLAGLATAPLIVAGIGLLGAAILGGLVPETLDRRGSG